MCLTCGFVVGAGGPTTDVVSSASAAAVPAVRLPATALRVRLRGRRVRPREGAVRGAARAPRAPSAPGRGSRAGGGRRGVPRGHDAAAAGRAGDQRGYGPMPMPGYTPGYGPAGYVAMPMGDAGEAAAPRHPRRVQRPSGEPRHTPSASAARNPASKQHLGYGCHHCSHHSGASSPLPRFDVDTWGRCGMREAVGLPW